jgi:hypothetical protein
MSKLSAARLAEIAALTPYSPSINGVPVIPDLLAEIERLQGLIKQAEWAGERGVESGDCPWCGASAMYDKNRHEPTCPAFGSAV